MCAAIVEINTLFTAGASCSEPGKPLLEPSCYRGMCASLTQENMYKQACRHSLAVDASKQPTQTSKVAQYLYSRESEVPDVKISNGTVNAPQSKH